MMAHDQDWLMTSYAPLAVLFGEADYALPLRGDKAFQRAQRQVATGFFVPTALVLLRNPDILLFLARDAGILVLVELAQEMADRGTPTVETGRASVWERVCKYG